jgi:hypothetical protein
MYPSVDVAGVDVGTELWILILVRKTDPVAVPVAVPQTLQIPVVPSIFSRSLNSDEGGTA